VYGFIGAFFGRSEEEKKNDYLVPVLLCLRSILLFFCAITRNPGNKTVGGGKGERGKRGGERGRGARTAGWQSSAAFSNESVLVPLVTEGEGGGRRKGGKKEKGGGRLFFSRKHSYSNLNRHPKRLCRFCRKSFVQDKEEEKGEGEKKEKKARIPRKQKRTTSSAYRLEISAKRGKEGEKEGKTGGKPEQFKLREVGERL